jgi:hypothetical protein
MSSMWLKKKLDTVHQNRIPIAHDLPKQEQDLGMAKGMATRKWRMGNHVEQL